MPWKEWLLESLSPHSALGPAELCPVDAGQCGYQQLHEALEVKGLFLQGPPPAC